MWFQRSSVVIHGTSFPGVSLTRLSQPADEAAPAVAGTTSQAATHSEASHADTSKRDLKGTPMNPPRRSLIGASCEPNLPDSRARRTLPYLVRDPTPRPSKSNPGVRPRTLHHGAQSW